MSGAMKSMIYLDYNATAPIRENVIAAVAGAMATVGNPSSVHGMGRAARAKVEEARAQVAALANARPRDVVFCASGTEASNTVIRGAGAKSLILSPIEHDCVRAAAKESGLPVFKLKVNAHGVVDLADLAQKLEEAPKPALVSVMLANNEMGTIEPVAEIAEIAHAHGALVHTDAVQAAGKMMLDRKALGADYLTLSAHKIGGPQGVGAIILAPTAPLKALIPGGGQELSRRSGTENVAGIAGFGVAALECMADIGRMAELGAMRDRIEREVKAYGNDVVIVGEGAPRLPNTICIAMPGVKGETQVMHFDLNGICVSSGSACSSGKVKVSHVLTAMGYGADVAEASIRISLGYGTKESDVDAFLKAWTSLYDRIRSRR
ncbi:cysteine desulfurase family protein [Kordiimonas gwangyangensis]|uniref:cysteine desulfurase family protein n=1 Tax=Kordiimonas gwangyangensis TaxID=288022 RepID=UPI000ACDFC1D|nr:cysteine desulfurase family protein [Kordiimonas gwangyangensis]